MKRVFLLGAILIMSLFSFVGCGSNENSDSGNKDGDSIALNIYELYSNSDDASFAKISVKSIDENIYCALTNKSSHYIMLECLIEEDFYGKLESGTIIYLPVALNKPADSYYDYSIIKEWFESNEYILSYFCAADERFELKDLNTDKKYEWTDRFYACGLDSLSIIPIRNNKVDLSALYSLTDGVGHSHDLHSEYVNYIDNGMTLEDVSENLKKLAIKAK